MKISDDDMMHLIVKWNPLSEFHSVAPDTIRLHCDILNSFAEDINSQYVYWGKVSKSGKLGVNSETIKLINNNIKFKNKETHLYLYCPDRQTPSLHVGCLIGIETLDKSKNVHTPKYYNDFSYKIPFWFKLKDIRRIKLDELNNLKEIGGNYFDPVSSNFYPLVIFERNQKIFFNDYSNYKTELEEYLMRCFKTGTTCAKREILIFNPKQVFIGMPFRVKFNNAYKYVIEPVLKDRGYQPWIANEVFDNIDIMCKVCEGIQSSKYGIIDISGWSPNVLFELGILYGLSKEVVLIKKENNKVPIDLNGIEYLSYNKNFDDLKSKLSKYLDIIK